MKHSKNKKFEQLNKNSDSEGCSDSFLQKRIVHQLLGNMSEENYGSGWCIDHCYLLSKTDLSNAIHRFKSTKWIIVLH